MADFNDIVEQDARLRIASAKHVLEMLVGDYLLIYLNALQDELEDETITINQLEDDMGMFCDGIHHMGEVFGIDIHALDKHKLLTEKYGDAYTYEE